MNSKANRWCYELSSLTFLVFVLSSVNGFPRKTEVGTSTTNDSKLNRAESFIDSMKKQGHYKLMIDVPNRIIQLSELLELPEWNEENMDNLHKDSNIPIPDHTKTSEGTTTDNDESSNAKVYSFSTGMAPSNDKIIKFVQKTKATVIQMVKDSYILRSWITFMVPKIEDGNNFGVSIQKEIINKIESVQEQAAVLFIKISQYCIKRADILSKIAKFPHVEDYRKAVDEFDEDYYFLVQVNIDEIRASYAVLYDVLVKNKEKLVKPRPSSGDSVYRS